MASTSKPLVLTDVRCSFTPRSKVLPGDALRFKLSPQCHQRPSDAIVDRLRVRPSHKSGDLGSRQLLDHEELHRQLSVRRKGVERLQGGWGILKEFRGSQRR